MTSLIGENSLTVPVPSLVTTLLAEVRGTWAVIHARSVTRHVIVQLVQPFYVFQLLCCVLWTIDNYLAYGNIILSITKMLLLSSALASTSISASTSAAQQAFQSEFPNLHSSPFFQVTASCSLFFLALCSHQSCNSLNMSLLPNV